MSKARNFPAPNRRLSSNHSTSSSCLYERAATWFFECEDEADRYVSHRRRIDLLAVVSRRHVRVDTAGACGHSAAARTRDARKTPRHCHTGLASRQVFPTVQRLSNSSAWHHIRCWSLKQSSETRQHSTCKSHMTLALPLTFPRRRVLLAR